MTDVIDEVRILLVLVLGAVLDQVTAVGLIALDVDLVVLLGARHLVEAAGIGRLQTADREATIENLLHVRAIALTVADGPCAGATVTHVEDHRALGLARIDQHRRLDAPTVHLEAHHRLDLHVVLETEFLDRGWRHQGDLVPAHLGDRLRNLLEPGVVGKAPVMDRRIGTGDEGQPGLARRGRGARRIGDRCRISRHRSRGRTGVCEVSVVEHLSPRCLETGVAQTSLPGLAHEVVAGGVLSQQSRDDLRLRLGAVQRFDQRLLEAERAVEGPAVAPALEVVSQRDVPVALETRLVGV